MPAYYTDSDLGFELCKYRPVLFLDGEFKRIKAYIALSNSDNEANFIRMNPYIIYNSNLPLNTLMDNYGRILVDNNGRILIQ